MGDLVVDFDGRVRARHRTNPAGRRNYNATDLYSKSHDVRTGRYLRQTRILHHRRNTLSGRAAPGSGLYGYLRARDAVPTSKIKQQLQTQIEGCPAWDAPC
jgi:hypothetical protein